MVDAGKEYFTKHRAAASSFSTMQRITGSYRVSNFGEERVRAFVPMALPPADPPLVIEGRLALRHSDATAALAKLEVAANMVPSADWFLYGFVRKEAVISSQIEG